MHFDPIILLEFPVILFCITIHEASHGWMANRCGDPTAAQMGRVTLNPIPHIDVIGTIIIPLFMMISAPGFALIGWGKPCPVNPHNFRSYRRDDILVSIAGVTSNFLAAISSLILLKLLFSVGITSQGVMSLFQLLFFINIALMIFNLIPIPPLDGSHVLRQFLSPSLSEKLDFLDRWGFLILIIFINTPVFDWLFNFFMRPFSWLLNIVIAL